ncbi:MAG: hypothetical protein MUO76_01890 [Anaerolineaceae bacterium]|nr:hypothetical protein [Anaerolineaceae bacterium]
MKLINTRSCSHQQECELLQGSHKSTSYFPRYPLPAEMLLHISVATLLGKQRSFQHDARRLLSRLKPPLQVFGREHIPDAEPCLLVLNHYSREGFGAWWIALAISAVSPRDIHWIMTGAWTFPGKWFRHTLKTATEWAFAQAARVYRFTPMSPMPPDPTELQKRSEAVRKSLTYARRTQQPIVGLSPEGRDFPDGKLGWPPPGAGKFMLQFVRLGMDITPVGVFEQDGMLCLDFGPCFKPDVPDGISLAERDHIMSCIVMERIARQLPAHLRGEFG